MSTVVQSLEVELPLYTITCYRENLFRIVKRCFTPSGVTRSSKGESQSYDVKCTSAVYRARSKVREYALCNNWSYFCTLTFDRQKVDRYDLKSILKTLMDWLDNMRQRKYPKLRYLLVPEPHKDGAWHLHGFFDGVPLSPLPSWAPVDLLEGGYEEWTEFRLRFGWCTFALIRSAVAVGFYVTKYITKNLARTVVPVGVHLYYHSRGIQQALRVGCRYWESPLLDSCLKNDSVYWRSGFATLNDLGFDDFGRLVDLCDEVTDMYQSFVLTDDFDMPLVILGGEDIGEDDLQLLLSAFRTPDLVSSPWDSSGPCSS